MAQDMRKLLNGILFAMTAVAIPGAPSRADTLHVTDDAYIQADDPDKNEGSSSKIKLKDDPGTIEDRVGFAKFDLSTLPSGVVAADIIKATLRMWIRKVSREGSIVVELVDASPPWDEDTLTFNNAPDSGTQTATVAIVEGDEDSIVTVDITALVKSWLNGGTNNGIALVPTLDLKAEITSKEGDEARAMEIEVVLGAGSTTSSGAHLNQTQLLPGAPGNSVISTATCPVGQFVTGCHGGCTTFNIGILADRALVDVSPSGGFSGTPITSCSQFCTRSGPNAGLTANAIAFCAP